jgi:hypothetical protein
MKKLTIALLLIFSFSLFSFSQNNIIEGEILDENNLGLPFANVLLMSSVDSSFIKGEYSDEQGRFALEDLQESNYFIQVSMVGYADYMTEIIIIDSKQNRKNLDPILLITGMNLDEVVVTAQRPFIEMSVEKIIVNVENSSIAVGDNAIEILKKSPGVLVGSS